MSEKQPQAQKPDPAFVATLRQSMRDCACWQARSMARRITQFYDAGLAAYGLTMAQFGLLALVAGAHDDTLGALAERAGLDQSTLTRNLQALEREGLVGISTREGDQRRRFAWVSDKGLTQLHAAHGAWAKAQDELAALIPLASLKDAAKAAATLP